MDIREMKVLKAVISTGSTSAAARQLNVSQPAISKAVKQLEADIRMPLFERIGRKLSPTAQAIAIMADIDRAIASQEAIKQRIEEVRSGRRGIIKIAAAAMASSRFLPIAIAAYRNAYCGVDFSVTTTTTREVTKLVYENKVDIGVCQHTASYNNLCSIPLYPASIVCAMPSDHPLSEKESVTPEDLMRYSLIVANFNEPLVGARIAETFNAKGLYPPMTLECNISYTAFGLVSAGLGVALVDSYTVPAPGTVTRRFVPTVDLHLHAIFSGEHALSPIAKSFCDFLSKTSPKFDSHQID